MITHPIAKLMAEKGVDKIDLAMFSEDDRKEIYSQAADILLRLNKTEDALVAMERSGRGLPTEQLKRIAENKMMLGQHREAYELLLKTGQTEMAEFIKTNFLD